MYGSAIFILAVNVNILEQAQGAQGTLKYRYKQVIDIIPANVATIGIKIQLL